MFEGIEALRNPKISFIDRSTSSENTLAMIDVWIRSCMEKHSCQRLRRDVEFVPMRLIDTEQRDDSGWRLCVNIPGQQQPVSYMTLSHCWGTASFLQLKTSTIESFRAGLPLLALPRSFQDAVHVVRRVGERYLWIDSICIIQDSPKDWKEQSVLMGEVYSNSICNIAATGAADSSQGCFVSRQESDLICTLSKNSSTFFTQDQAIVNLQQWSDEVEQTRLNQRGWVLQERLLAPRIVHFGSKQVFWECSQMNACETYPEKMPSPFHRDYLPSLRTLFYMALESLKKETYGLIRWPYWSTEAEQFWATFVKHYSRCGITKSSDKLVAITAIVLQLQKATKDEYCAGLWKSYLPRQLMWNVCQGREGPRFMRPAGHRAPTWSWASIDALIDTVNWEKDD